MSSIIDISHWQEITTMADIKAGGVLAVIMKCTQGTTYLDPTFKSRYRDAIKIGLPVSTYHYLDAGKDPALQMDWYLKNLQPRQGERVCIDYEAEGSTLSDLKKAVQRVMDARPDLQITVYSGHLIKQVLGDKYDALLADNTSLWIAHYTTNKAPTWPEATWPYWSLWQYTDKGSTKGIKGNVDLNNFNGQDDNIAKWIGPVSLAPTPEPKPEPAPEPAPDPLPTTVTITTAFDVVHDIIVDENLPSGAVEISVRKG